MTNIVEQKSAKQLFDRPEVKAKFAEMLDKRSTQFITSVLQIVASNKLLQNAEPNSVYGAAMTAATLDLPLNNNLGFAYIVPYKSKTSSGQYVDVAQFQIGYKGYIQLAQRSGQMHKISAAPVHEGQIDKLNPLEGTTFNWEGKTSNRVIGYASYFKLVNGFEATLYMTVDEVSAHALKYSQTFKRGLGNWKDNFEAMALKTVLKLLLSKYAPLSVEMQRAITHDQAVISRNEEGEEVEYSDVEDVVIDKQSERLAIMLSEVETMEQLLVLRSEISEDQYDLLALFEQQEKQLIKTAKK